MLTIPVEILTRIFEACEDFPQVVAFASTCKHSHAAWVANSPIIIWSVGKSQIRSFDDVLMAVNILFSHYQFEFSRLRNLGTSNSHRSQSLPSGDPSTGHCGNKLAKRKVQGPRPC